jgi:hypothetical protein
MIKNLSEYSSRVSSRMEILSRYMLFGQSKRTNVSLSVLHIVSIYWAKMASNADTYL